MGTRAQTWMHYNTDGSGQSVAATLGVHEEYTYQVVDTSTDSTTVYNGPCILKGVYVNTGLSAHTVVMKDNTAAVCTIPASAAAGAMYTLPGIVCATSLVCDPDNNSTGSITVVYRPL
jgi:hypothetical protein